MASVDFSPMEAQFAIHMAGVVKNRVAELKTHTHSGIDQLLLDSQTIEIDRFIEKMNTCVEQPVPFFDDQAPEA